MWNVETNVAPVQLQLDHAAFSSRKVAKMLREKNLNGSRERDFALHLYLLGLVPQAIR